MKSTKFALATILLLAIVMVLSTWNSATAILQVTSTPDEPTAVSEVTAEPSRNMGERPEVVSHYPEPVALFEQYEYTDPETGYTIPYNLYLPEGYDESQEYPLVIFIGDASVNSDIVTDPLAQDGAAVWATEEEQAKHKTIVLVPQYTETLKNSLGALTGDDHQWTEGLTLVSNLIFAVVEQYSVDENRIYGTGQSQGCMTTIAISDKYPDFFAAQLLVAGQWDAEEMSAMVDDQLWIVVCEGDTKAFPGMNEAVANWESLGASVATSDMWDSTSSADEFDSLVADMLSQGSSINYTVFEGGNHMYTWTVAYTIEGIRDWLFTQTKATTEASAVEDIESVDDLVQTARDAIQSGEIEIALSDYSKAADLGSSEAAEALARIYTEGTVVEQDYGEAIQWLEIASELGSTRASVDLGIMYRDGVGIDADYVKAIDLFTQATEAGDRKAPRHLAIMYEEGLGVDVDYTKAAEYYELAADRGDITGTYRLGLLYLEGHGVEKNDQKAFEYIYAAADNENSIAAECMEKLGNMYENGIGVDADLDKAIEWYQKAAAYGYQDAITQLNRLGAEIPTVISTESH